MKYIKLSELVGKDFTFIKNNGYVWKKWDDNAKKYLTSTQPQSWVDGWRKIYQVETDLGAIDFSQAQISSMLVSALKGNSVDLSNIIFEVGSNGKSGIDIRYYFKPKGTQIRVENRTEQRAEEEFGDFPM